MYMYPPHNCYMYLTELVVCFIEDISGGCGLVFALKECHNSVCCQAVHCR